MVKCKKHNIVHNANKECPKCLKERLEKESKDFCSMFPDDSNNLD